MIACCRAMKTPRAGCSHSCQRRRGANLQPEPGASSSGDPTFLKSIISGTADAVSMTWKAQPASRMKISRDSECDEPRVVRGSSKDRQGRSRDHVEEGHERKPNKRNDGTFHRDNTTPCTTHHHTPTSTARAGALMPRVGPGQHPRYTRADFGQVAVGGSTTTTRTRR